MDRPLALREAEILELDSAGLVVEVHAIVGSPVPDTTSAVAHLSDALRGVLLADTTLIIADLGARRLIVGSPTKPFRFLAAMGEGPGEIRHPSGLLPGVGGDLGVLDNALHRLIPFSFHVGGSRAGSPIPTNGQPRAVCAVGPGYIGLGYDASDSSLLRQFARSDSGFHAARTFGGPVVMGSAGMNQVWSQGRVACPPGDSTMVALLASGDVVAFGMDGLERWHRRIARFAPHLAKETSAGVITGRIAEERNRSTIPISLLAVSDSLGLIQLAEYHRQPVEDELREERTGVWTVLFDLRSGEGKGFTRSVPQILDLNGDLALILKDEDGPRLAVVRFVVRRR